MVRAIDILLECEAAYDTMGNNYASLVCETCYSAGDCIQQENGTVYEKLKNLYESCTDDLHKIIITDRHVEYKQVVESIKNRTVYIFIPVSTEVTKHYVLQDYFSMFDYVVRMVSDNYTKCKSSYCKKCKAPRIRKLKVENRSRYWQIDALCKYLNSEYYNVQHSCAGVQ